MRSCDSLTLATLNDHQSDESETETSESRCLDAYKASGKRRREEAQNKTDEEKFESRHLVSYETNVAPPGIPRVARAAAHAI